MRCSTIAGDIDRLQIAYPEGGLICQSAHFNRAAAAALKLTASAFA